MSQGDVQNVVRLGEVNSAAVADTGKSVRCIRRFALSAALRLWYPSGLGVTARCTVAIASAQ
jgi:hypothetical protein